MIAEGDDELLALTKREADYKFSNAGKVTITDVTHYEVKDKNTFVARISYSTENGDENAFIITSQTVFKGTGGFSFRKSESENYTINDYKIINNKDSSFNKNQRSSNEEVLEDSSSPPPCRKFVLSCNGSGCCTPTYNTATGAVNCSCNIIGPLPAGGGCQTVIDCTF